MIQGPRHAPSGGHILIVLVYAILSGLSGLLTVPPLDRDESRFIQATTQMIETGDYVTIMFQESERNKKPIGIYWLQAASVQSFADVEDRPLWAFRLPSLLAAAAAGLFTYLAGCALVGRQAAFAGAILLVSAPVVLGEASIAKTDASLLAAITAMQACLAWLLTDPRALPPRRLAAGAWAALGAAILLKGPIGPLIAVFTVGALLLRDFSRVRIAEMARRFRPVMGIAILVLMVVPWFLAITVTTEGRFLAEAFGNDTLGKVTEAQESHGFPPGYHLAVFWVMFWPGTLFALFAARVVAERWRESPVFFLLAWAVPMFVLFEAAVTKLPHYTMVTYPALALLMGYAVVSVAEDRFRAWRLSGAIVYPLIGIGATIAIVLVADRYSSAGLVVWHYLGATLVMGVTILAASLVILRRSRAAIGAAALASSLYAWGAFEGVLPTLDRLAVTPRLAEMLDNNEAHPLRDDTGPVVIVGYGEPSAVFTLGTETLHPGPRRAAAILRADPSRPVVVEERYADAFLSAFGNDERPEPVASIEGFNYSRNEDVRLTLYRFPKNVRARS